MRLILQKGRCQFYNRVKALPSDDWLTEKSPGDHIQLTAWSQTTGEGSGLDKGLNYGSSALGKGFFVQGDHVLGWFDTQSLA